MPYKDKEKQLEYLKKYNSIRHPLTYADRKQKLVEFLGGKCNKCDSKDKLEFDHIIRETKEFSIMKKWNSPMEVLLPELKKCQLLCTYCHKQKTKQERRELV